MPVFDLLYNNNSINYHDRTPIYRASEGKGK